MNCPACGVPVVPGYARCPKCHAPLPRRAITTVEGGTALDEPRRVPLAALIAAGVIGVGIIVWLGVRRGSTTAPVIKANTPASRPAVATAPQPALAPAVTDTQVAPKAPAPEIVASELARTLGRQRLWSTVTVTGSRVEIRGGSCSDPAIEAPITDASRAFKAAGLTTLRCVEQSGAVVFSREL
jgi:hypothetical protein